MATHTFSVFQRTFWLTRIDADLRFAPDTILRDESGNSLLDNYSAILRDESGLNEARFNAETFSIALSGSDAELIGRVVGFLTADSAAFGLTGTETTFSRALTFKVTIGDFALTGIDAGIEGELAAFPAAFGLTASDVTFQKFLYNPPRLPGDSANSGWVLSNQAAPYLVADGTNAGRVMETQGPAWVKEE